jgi:penicillin-binding protein 1A
MAKGGDSQMSGGGPGSGAGSVGRARSMRRNTPTWAERIRIFFGVLLMLVLTSAVVGIGVAAYFFREAAIHLPNIDSLLDYSPGGVTEIYATDKDPKTGQYYLLGRVFNQNKQFCPITEIPKVLQDATVSIEDERFYSHRGIDLQGIARAFYRDVRSERVEEGGSTLTQQLARNMYLTQRRTASRKLKEILLALEMEKNYSKEQILELYLNVVAYGGNNYGVKAASETYFGKQPKDLTLPEAALIAGLPKSPNGYFPFHHPAAAIKRRNNVLAKMADLGYITPAQAQAAEKTVPHFAPYNPLQQSDFRAPYFTNYVLRLLIEKYGEDMVYRGGLRVYTTLNWKMQQAAEQSLVEGVHNFRAQGVTEGALVCLEPHTGYIRAMVGGTDFHHNQFNNVIQGRRQPGSSFKAFVYSAAFDLYPDRFGPYKDVDDADATYGGKYHPENDDNRYHGRVSATDAFANSFNAAAVWTTNEIGVRHVIEYARRMGIASDLQPNLSLALGSNAVTPLEMCSAYTTFDNHGSRAHPMAIRTVLDHDGGILEDDQPIVDQQVIKESTAESMGQMMAAVVDHGTAAGVPGIHDIVGARGKTGTTNDFRDAWFIGFTDQLATAVWVCGLRHETDKHGRPIAKYLPMQRVFGAVASAPIWTAFMKLAVPIQQQAGIDEQPQQKPTSPSASAQTPRVANADDVEARPREHASGTEPTAAATPTVAPAIDTPSPPPTDDATQLNTGAIDHPNGDAAAAAGGATTTTTTVSEPAVPTAPANAGAAPAADAGAVPAAAAQSGDGGANVPAVTAPAGAAPAVDGEAPAPAKKPTDGTSTSASNETAPIRRVNDGAGHAVVSAGASVTSRMVTVTLCADSGLRATRWCPETVQRTVPRSQAPRRWCQLHGPLPGDH